MALSFASAYVRAQVPLPMMPRDSSRCAVPMCMGSPRMRACVFGVQGCRPHHPGMHRCSTSQSHFLYMLLFKNLAAGLHVGAPCKW